MESRQSIAFGYWYGDGVERHESFFHSHYHYVRIERDENGTETVTALCGTKHQISEVGFKHCFKNMHFFNSVKASGHMVSEAFSATHCRKTHCRKCGGLKDWASLRDMVERIEEERWHLNNGNSV